MGHFSCSDRIHSPARNSDREARGRQIRSARAWEEGHGRAREAELQYSSGSRMVVATRSPWSSAASVMIQIFLPLLVL